MSKCESVYTKSIKMYAIEKNMNLSTLASGAGMSISSISNLLKYGYPNLKSLTRISKSLNVKLSDIILRAEAIEVDDD